MKEYEEIKHPNPLISKVQKKMYKLNNNWLAMITGGTGTGKSWSALSMAEKIDPSFTTDKVVLQPLDFVRNLAEDNWSQGDCIVFDEAGAGMSAKEHMTKKNRIIDQVLQTFRRKNIAVIFTVPSKSNVDRSVRRLLDTYIETKNIDLINERNELKWQNIDYNRKMDKIYYHYPKKRLENGATKKIKTVALPRPSEDLVERYEEKRSEFQSEKNAEFYQELLEKQEKGGSSKSFSHECNQCGNSWDGRVESPAQCPECMSRRWNKSEDDDKQEASVVKSQ